MPASPALSRLQPQPEADLVRRAARRDADAIRQIIKRHNQRLYRLARAVVGSNADAEDVLQEAYLRAFTSLDSFRGDSSLATWLSRITLNEAFARLRSQKRLKRAAPADVATGQSQIIPFPTAISGDDPERTMAQRQLLHLVEQATDDLPHAFRIVFVARVIEGLSVEETATLLGLRPTTVRTRLHRARKLVKDRLEAQVGPILVDAFPFAGTRCERLTEAVLARLDLLK